MILFEKLRLKNFLSYGNAWTEIDFRQGKILLAGKNGTGKSSLISDAISLALFGKPFRKINIPQLVNSINQKDCLVELEFSIGSKQYRVIRGLKPTKFEIYEDGQLLKQEAAVKDYQRYLESSILKINHKTFIQLLVLGSAVFTPFMQQPPYARRQIIEDVLDISIFSAMQKLLKEKIQKNKEETSLIDVKVDGAKKEAAAQKKLIETLSTKSEVYISRLQEELLEESSLLSVLVEKRDLAMSDVFSLTGSLISFDADLLDSAQMELSARRSEMKTSIDRAEKIDSLTSCPTCLQPVGDEHKAGIKSELKSRYDGMKPVLESMQQSVDELKKKRDSHAEMASKIRDAETVLRELQSDISKHEKRLIDLQNKIANQKDENIADIEKEREKLRQLANNALALIERKNELIVEKSIQEVSMGLLRDNGIKASIIKEYLPLLNKMINAYLAEFDFFVNFVLDENFDEKLLSRGRDNASYFSLSEGEKKRVDVAILMTFRHIAAMKNSARLDLLVLDELDAGLDHDSRLKLIDIIRGMDSNVWVVSHSIQNTELEQQFDKVAHVSKKGDFSDVTIS